MEIPTLNDSPLVFTDCLVTLRDQFAMAALPLCCRFYGDSGEPAHQRIAELAYGISDAMLIARKTPGASTPSDTPKETT